jgi:hypothetical protein
MPQKNNRKKGSGEVTRREVEKEMAKPRVVASVREAVGKADTDESSNPEEE